MSDEPMMQQISVRFMQPEEEAYINGRIAEAVQAERERIIRECVEPLMKAMRRIQTLLYQCDTDAVTIARDTAEDALAAVEAKLAGKEKTDED